MSGDLDILGMKEDDVTKFLVTGTHIGAPNVDFQMEQYIFKRRTDGIHIINIRKTWEKLLLAARAIVAIENSQDVCVISARPYSQRAVLKFAHYTGATPIAGRFTPGTFTNQIQAAFREPRLLVVSDPHVDHQPVTEASYVNIPVIAFCNTDSPLRYVDIAIPCNNKGPQSIGLMWWMLCREVLRLRGLQLREAKWDVMVDLFFYRDPEEAEKEEQAASERGLKEQTDYQPDQQWTGAEIPAPVVADPLDWANQVEADAAAQQNPPLVVPAFAAAPADWSQPAAPGIVPVTDDWSNQAPAAPETSDWGGVSENWG